MVVSIRDEEVWSTIKKIKNKKAVRPNGVPVKYGK